MSFRYQLHASKQKATKVYSLRNGHNIVKEMDALATVFSNIQLGLKVESCVN